MTKGTSRSLVVGLAISATALLAGCGGSQAAPTPTATLESTPAVQPIYTPDPNLPTYSAVLATYPEGTTINGTDAIVKGFDPDGNVFQFNTDGGGHLNGCGSDPHINGFICAGSKLTIGEEDVTIFGTTYHSGAKLTVDANIELVEVSSWE